MNDPVQLKISECVDAALEASCDTLIALEVILNLTGEHEPVRRTLRALSLTNRLIRELRVIRGEPAMHGLPLAFVLAAEGPPGRG